MTWKWIDIIATCKASIPNDRLNQAADVHPHLECVDKSQSCLTATIYIYIYVCVCEKYESMTWGPSGGERKLRFIRA